MRKIILKMLLISVLFSFAVLLNNFSLKVEATSTTESRYNVLFVVDASGSMENTDPNKLRFEAISLFANLLANDENYVGSVVFSTDIILQSDLHLVADQESKDNFINELKSTGTYSYSNIGNALLTATEMALEQGDPNLPSVIILISDGCTEMNNADDLIKSTEDKQKALQKAKENDISIYTLRLNHNGDTDLSEMMEIADVTGGEFEEVKDANNLKDAFNSFYNLLYGTTTNNILTDNFNSSQKLECIFKVPNFGIKDTNVVVYGNVDNVKIFNPSGEQVECSPSSNSNSLMSFKIDNVQAGLWKMELSGSDGDDIQVNITYNSDVTVSFDDNQGNSSLSSNGTKITAYIKSDGETAQSSEQLDDFISKIYFLDKNFEEVSNYYMQVEDNHFVYDDVIPNDSCYYYINIKCPFADIVTNMIGPFDVISVDTNKDNSSLEIQEEKSNIQMFVILFFVVFAIILLVLNNIYKKTKKFNSSITVKMHCGNNFFRGEKFFIKGIYSLNDFSLSVAENYPKCNITATNNGIALKFYEKVYIFSHIETIENTEYYRYYKSIKKIKLTYGQSINIKADQQTNNFLEIKCNKKSPSKKKER